MKRAAKIVLIGVCFGLILLLLKISFGIDDAAFMHGYWIAAVAIVLGAKNRKRENIEKYLRIKFGCWIHRGKTI